MKKRQKKKLSKRKARKLHIRLLEAELAEKTGEAETYRDRLYTLGLDENLEYIQGLPTVNFQTEVDLHPISWGNYMMACDEIPEDQFRAAKEELTRSIVRGLIKNGMVRFIYMKANIYDPLCRHNTLAARIDVIPWERLTNRAVIYKAFREAKVGETNGDIEKAGAE